MVNAPSAMIRRIAGWTAPLMFSLSIVFLICQAVLVVAWVDVPNFEESARAMAEAGESAVSRVQASIGGDIVDSRVKTAAITLMLAIWPLVVLESIYHWLTRPWTSSYRRYHLLGLLFCASPSFRMCARSPEIGDRIWLPMLGWRLPNKRLRTRLERFFSVPMMVIALMILPVLVIEYVMRPQVVQYPWLSLLLHVGTGIIWFAFAFEFILMISVAEKKLAYCRAHWLDIAIIALPVFSFLRTLRVLRASQVTKMAKVYRLRGTAVRVLRAFILLEIFQRMIGTDLDRQIESLEHQLVEVEAEAKELRRRIARLQRQREQQTAAEQGDELASEGDRPGESR